MLNDRQREAVLQVSGNLLVLAGAGSGKTTVVINRIYNMLKYGDVSSLDIPSNLVDSLSTGLVSGKKLSDFDIPFNKINPENILSITFTNKAAKELKDRLHAKLGDVADRIWSSTFHSMCAQILRCHADRLGYSSRFTIYDSDDTKRLIKECLKTLEIDEKNLPIKSCMSRISEAKDSLIDYKEFRVKYADDFKMSNVAKVYALYEDKKQHSDAMDFDDLIFNTVLLFKLNFDIKKKYNDRFKYVMVDEYQDTSKSQHELIKLLVGDSGNLCVVGDDDQSIYKFRGADVDNILSFDKYFKDVHIVRLEQNYRSTGNILSAANAVIRNNASRKEKALWTNSDAGSKVRLHVSYSEHDEAEKIANEILDGVKNGRKYSDYAVLYRLGLQSAVIEKLLTRNNIPFRVVGNIRFFEKKEVKDMIAYLSVINNQSDEIRLKRIINRPHRSIGDRTMQSIGAVASNTNQTFFDVIKNSSNYAELQRASFKISAFALIMNSLIEANKKGISLSDLYSLILEKTKYIDFVRSSEDEPEPRIENIKELGSYISLFESEKGDSASLEGFLEEISLISDSSSSEGEVQDYVTLMTIHASKGLEFPIVFLPGFEEGIFPSQQCIYEPENIEEERRLAYVALTRAKEQIFILNSTSRLTFGSTVHNKPSRFLSEIPQEIVDVSKSKEWQKISVQEHVPRTTHDLRVKSVVFARNFSKVKVALPRSGVVYNRSTPDTMSPNLQ